MRKTLILTLISISVHILFAQKPLSLESEKIAGEIFTTNDRPKVTGYLLNYDVELDRDLEIFYYPTKFNSQFDQHNAKIKADGSFEFTLPYSATHQELKIGIGEIYFEEVMVHQGLSLSIDLAKYRGKRILFPNLDGPDAELNRYLRKRNFAMVMQTAKHQLEIREAKVNKELSLLEKIKKLEEIYALIFKLNDAFTEKNPSPYTWIAEDRLKAQMYHDLVSLSWRKEIDESLLAEALAFQPSILTRETTLYYQSLSVLFSSETQEEKFLRTEKVLTSLITDESQKDSLHLYLAEYKKRRFKEPYDKEIYKVGANKYLKPYKQELEDAKLTIYAEKLAELPGEKANLIAFIGQPGDLWQRETFLAKVLPVLPESPYKTLMKDTWEADKQQVLKLDKVLAQDQALNIAHPYGTQVLTLDEKTSLYVSDKEEVETFLATIQEAHKDKSIILDIWTTWCGPCLMDMKQSKAIKAKMKDLPVKVIYLCMEDGAGSNLESWKKKVAEMGTEGEHILLPKDFAKKFMKHFKFNSYPSYVFMNKEGEIDLNLVKRISMINIEELKKRL